MAMSGTPRRASCCSIDTGIFAPNLIGPAREMVLTPPPLAQPPPARCVMIGTASGLVPHHIVLPLIAFRPQPRKRSSHAGWVDVKFAVPVGAASRRPCRVARTDGTHVDAECACRRRRFLVVMPRRPVVRRRFGGPPK